MRKMNEKVRKRPLILEGTEGRGQSGGVELENIPLQN